MTSKNGVDRVVEWWPAVMGALLLFAAVRHEGRLAVVLFIAFYAIGVSAIYDYLNRP